MESLMVLGLPGRELYCVTKTDQYYVFQNYFVRQRSARSPRDIRHAEISRYTPEASGHRKNAEVRDLRIPRRQVVKRLIQMRRSLLTRWDNCGTVKLAMADGTTHRFLVLGNHSAAELGGWFDIRSGEIRGQLTQSSVRDYQKKTKPPRNEKLEPVIRAGSGIVAYVTIVCSFLLALKPEDWHFFSSDISRQVLLAISLAGILLMLVLPLVAPQWFSHLRHTREGMKKNARFGLALFFPLVGLGIYTLRSVSYISYWQLLKLACIPSTVMALLLWIVSKEKTRAPARMTVFCLAFAVLGFGIGGSVNKLVEQYGPAQTEQAQVIEHFDLGPLHCATVDTSRGELTCVDPYETFIFRANRNVTVSFYDGLLGIPFATVTEGPKT